MIAVTEIANCKSVFCAKILIEPSGDFTVICEAGFDVGITSVRISRRQVLQQGKRRGVVGSRRNLRGIGSSAVRDIREALPRIRWACCEARDPDASRIEIASATNGPRR